MNITIRNTFLPHTDADATLAFYRDVLGFEVRGDVGRGQMRWITIGPPGQPGTSIVLHPAAVDPGITEEERRTIVEMMAKGTYAIIILATDDLDGTFERLQASGADVVQEPTEQPYGIRDCAFRDPAGPDQDQPGPIACSATYSSGAIWWRSSRLECGLKSARSCRSSSARWSLFATRHSITACHQAPLPGSDRPTFRMAARISLWSWTASSTSSSTPSAFAEARRVEVGQFI